MDTILTDDAAPNERLIVAVARQRIYGRFAHQIAAEVGVHPSELSHWMYGRRSLTDSNAAKLAAALGCEPEDILPHNDDAPAGGERGVKASGRDAHATG